MENTCSHENIEATNHGKVKLCFWLGLVISNLFFYYEIFLKDVFLTKGVFSILYYVYIRRGSYNIGRGGRKLLLRHVPIDAAMQWLPVGDIERWSAELALPVCQ
jgi:hypothetical protein